MRRLHPSSPRFLVDAVVVMLISSLLVVVLPLLSSTAVAAQQQTTDTSGNDNTDNNSAAGAIAVPTDPSICAIPYDKTKNLEYQVQASDSASSGSAPATTAAASSAAAVATTTFLFSISPCTNTTIVSPTGAVCGMGFAGWTERTPQHNATCMYLYTRNLTSDKSSTTIYATEEGTETLVVNWLCTGLQGDLDPTVQSVRKVTGNRTRREVTIQTKGCLLPDTGELRAGVIVAICVVAVFVLVVILSVVRAKCGGSSSSSSAASGGAVNGDYSAAP